MNRIFPETVGQNIILFLGEAPYKEEIRQNRPFVGRAGNILRTVIGDRDYTIDNVYPYITDPPRMVKGKELRESPYIKKLNFNNFGRVVLLGRNVIDVILPKRYNKFLLDDIVGTIVDKKFILCYHPSYIVRTGGKNSKYYKRFKETIDSAYE